MVRHKNYIWVIIIFFSFSIFGCATIPTLERPIEKSRTFKASFEELWQALIPALTSAGEFVTVAEKDSGFITFQKVILIDRLREYALMPSGWTCHNIGQVSQLVLLINVVTTKPDEKHVTVTINSKFPEIRCGGFWDISWPIRTFSTNGKLEKEYLNKIEALFPNKSYKWLREEEK